MAVAVDRAETSHGAVSDTLSDAAVSGLRAVDVPPGLHDAVTP